MCGLYLYIELYVWMLGGMGCVRLYSLVGTPIKGMDLRSCTVEPYPSSKVQISMRADQGALASRPGLQG